MPDDVTSLGRFCGNRAHLFPPPIATTKRIAYIKFKSDVSVAHNGFRLEWVANGCGGRFVNKPAGVLMSPNYPDVYPNSVECLWKITVGFGMSIELNVLEYDMESAQECYFDSLTVYGGPDETSPQLSQFCQRRTTNQTVTSTGNNMFVKFKTDGSVRGKGFKATFKTLPQGKWRNIFCQFTYSFILSDTFCQLSA